MKNQSKVFDSWQPARSAVEAMQKYGIKPEEKNYAVWLAYYTESNANLKLDLDNLIKKDKHIDEHACYSLYERYIEREALSEKIINAGSSVANEIRDIMNDIETVEEKTRNFGIQLAAARVELDSAEQPSQIKSIVGNLSVATEDMEDNSKALEVRLVQSRNEIEALRMELEQVRTEAATDALTGVANRKTFEVFMHDQTEKAKKTRKPLSIILADIDHFKRVNDTWGHQTGDQVICFVAGVMQREMPRNALVARIGGEEFALIAPDLDARKAKALAEKIRNTVANKKLIRRSSKEDLGQIAVSLGVAEYNSSEKQSDLVARADKALYHSKNHGRNQTTLFDDVKSLAA